MTIEMDSDKNVQAVFEEDKLSVSVSLWSQVGSNEKHPYQRLSGTIKILANGTLIKQHDEPYNTALGFSTYISIPYDGKKITILIDFTCLDTGFGKMSTITFTNGTTIKGSGGKFHIENTFYANQGVESNCSYRIQSAK